jgi:hypothetical protein
MEPIFTLPYPEHATIEAISKAYPKTKDCSIFIPASRQQKGVDFIILNKKKAIRFQVKSSKAYLENKKSKFTYHLWLNNFIKKYDQDNADWYVFYGLYSTINPKSTKKLKNPKAWNSIILCFKEKELLKLLDSATPFIDIFFNLDEKGKVKDIIGTRGFKKHLKLEKFLLHKRKLL